ncbi:ABC transporter ATP-binding protein [Paenibacillus hodogayensis]|uniref:ABC transporter ATP-binding protein n=1 Tax=Paenibacillus hodogayensis TaxID=279208 RepID=A0ABV5VRZ9_9BACL
MRIKLDNVGKKYKVFNGAFARVIEWVIAKKMHREKWVLRNLTFEVGEGESLGIIGHNGAGKSTLLKILTGVLPPSEGSFSTSGSIAALLELGMGFHPDFTGIQNIRMSLQLTGVDNEKIDRLIPEIEAFAEIGDYVNQPLRTYSSGMSVRLAFATATAIRPDILIVDEALSVGDVYFQHKCFDRIKKFREEGTTLLFVSHDPGAIKNLCDRAILLDQGVLVKEGTPEAVLDYYNAVVALREVEYSITQSVGENNRINTRSGSGELTITKVDIVDKNDRLVHAIQVGERIQVRIAFQCSRKIVNPTVGFVIKDRLGNAIFGTNTYQLNVNAGEVEDGTEVIVLFSLSANIGMGTYSVTAAIHEGLTHISKNYDWWDHAFTFQVIKGQEPAFDGTIYLPSSATFHVFNESR